MTSTGTGSSAEDELLDSPHEDQLIERGRALLGVTGDSSRQPLRQLMRDNHVSLYPALALALLSFVDGFQGLVVGQLGPDIARSLGMSVNTFALLNQLKTLALALGAVAIADLVGRRAVRAFISILTGAIWSVATLFTGLVKGPGGLALVNILDGASSGSVAAAHTPLLLDSYPPAVRVRMTALRSSLLIASGVGAPLLITLMVTVGHLTWRGCLIVLAVPSLVATLLALRLRDPGFGRFDTQRVRDMVRETESTEAAPAAAVAAEEPAEASLSFTEACRRILLIPSMRRLIVVNTVAGIASGPATTYFNFYLQDHFGLGDAGRGIFASLTALLGAIAIAVAGPYGDRLYSSDPARVVTVVIRVQLVSLVASVIGLLSPYLWLLVLTYGLAAALPTAISPALSTTVMNIAPARLRGAFIALLSIASIAVGATLGTFLFAGLDREIGLLGALVFSNVPYLLGIVMLRGIRKDINADLDATVAAAVEQEELAVLRARGVTPPLLSCKGINFSYGNLQVLFDVSFTVDDGEMVALLGTNGAGKSTLLGVVSGLNLPSRGTVRLRGGDITYVDAERRVGMGISQVLGGKATFGALTVAENLRTFGFSHGRKRATIERGIEESFAAFPRLAERRNQLAQTLSGGEQQMLGLSQALILRPQLLCIDELSLGLAPKIVGELLEMVERIHAMGTAIVLVEQSATIALSLVDHAYFMERGEIRFDGRASDLLERNDLLRSVFLQGAGAGFAGA